MLFYKFEWGWEIWKLSFMDHQYSPTIHLQIKYFLENVSICLCFKAVWKYFIQIGPIVRNNFFSTLYAYKYIVNAEVKMGNRYFTLIIINQLFRNVDEMWTIWLTQHNNITIGGMLCGKKVSPLLWCIDSRNICTMQLSTTMILHQSRRLGKLYSTSQDRVYTREHRTRSREYDGTVE
jgi:hypothetical protein